MIVGGVCDPALDVQGILTVHPGLTEAGYRKQLQSAEKKLQILHQSFTFSADLFRERCLSKTKKPDAPFDTSGSLNMFLREKQEADYYIMPPMPWS